MNEELANYYGTLENLGIDKTASDFQLEKMAEAEVLDEMLKAEGYDIDRVPTEDIVKMAHELFGDDSALVQQAVALEQEKIAEEEPQEETFQEKVAEADYLGRLMAHAYVNELAEIEKQAASLAGAKEVIKGIPAALAGKARAMKQSYQTGAKGSQVMSKLTGKDPSKVREAMGGVKKMVKEHPKTLAGTGLGALGLGGAVAAS